MQSDQLKMDSALVPLLDRDDILRCVEYVTLREKGEVVAMEVIAEHFKITKETLYQWVHKWKKSGVIQEVRKLMMTPQIEAIQQAEMEVLREWPAILKRQIKTAKEGESLLVSLEASKWLNEIVISKHFVKDEAGDLGETLYINSLEDDRLFNPLE